eukprot:gnl/TRDRNA2_/TRDRNA2_177840_c0_seq1.p1 gnl/TRDRNA2_/TRDRNA2_177840_c0~~gnl/TRDRNA2_/TRDRNA2_177840_c0_seq1.p1  ORF type:complete len:975 (+),score=152.67 gnl/TRDRNA2_/TRDRNA2_177840_c0_seq1:99-3023(+)
MKQWSFVVLAFFFVAINPSNGSQLLMNRDPEPAPRPKLRASVATWLEKTKHVLSSTFEEVENSVADAEGRVVREVRFVRDIARNVTDQSKKPSEYYRPVSPTVICTIALTITSLSVYTALAISRNRDELSGCTEPSIATDTLSAASRITCLPPMMCMLFVACRMYVLATTEGLGEPQPWAKACMIGASCGIGVQILLVLLLPALVKLQKKEKNAETKPETFSEIVGDSTDAHPMLNRASYEHGAGGKGAAWCIQSICIAAIYGGVTGVMVAIFVYPQGTTRVSPAVICTVILSILYFGTYLSHFFVRTSTVPDDPSVEEASSAQRARNATQCAIDCVTKAPMFAVLFLAARMRALQLDPPYGMPPPWAQACFFTITGLIILETLAAATVGFTGKQQGKAYYGYKVYHANPAIHITQHMCAIIAYLLLIPVIVAVVMMKNKSGADMGKQVGPYAPLSPMMIAILWLSGLYHGVGMWKWIVFFLQDVCGKTYAVARDTVIAAGVSLAFCPLLCVLFLATRMRALQISQNMGNPQAWAQDCFFICVFATYTQALCCLLMPIFTGAATQVDGDGNTNYDLRPMVGAYAVTMVKYVALMALHGGVIAVAISVFTITPEQALDKHDNVRGMKEVMIGVLITMLVLLLATLGSSAKAVGLAIKFGIEHGAPLATGVDVFLEKANLSVCEGYVYVAGLKMVNPDVNNLPEGHPGVKAGHPGFKSPHLMKVDTLCVKLAMGKLFCSCGGTFEITTAVFHGINVTYEKPGIHYASNVDVIVEYIQSKLPKKDETPPPPPPPPPPKDDKPKKSLSEKYEDAKKTAEDLKTAYKWYKRIAPYLPEFKPPPPPKLVLGEIEIMDVDAIAMISGQPIKASLGNIEPIKNFMEEKCGGRDHCTVGDIIKVLMSQVVHSIMQNKAVAGQMGKAAVAMGKEIIGDAAHAVGGALGTLSSKLGDKLFHHKKGDPEPEPPKQNENNEATEAAK